MQTVFFDVYTATEQVCEEVNFSTEWVESLDTLDEVTEANFFAWIKTNGENVLDMHWALKQLHNVLTQKVTGQVNKFTQAEMGKEAIQGATTWKRVQIHAEGVTQNRRQQLLDAVSFPKRQIRTTSWPSCCQLGKRRFVSWRSSVSPHSVTIRRLVFSTGS